MGYRAKHTLQVRFKDIDMLGHVNNAVYFTYFEEARQVLFKSWGFTPEKFQTECPVIVAHAECDYKSPAILSEILDIHIGILEIRNASFVVGYEIREQTSDRLVALGNTAMVTFDFQKQKVTPIPDFMRKPLEELLVKK